MSIISDFLNNRVVRPPPEAFKHAVNFARSAERESSDSEDEKMETADEIEESVLIYGKSNCGSNKDACSIMEISEMETVDFSSVDGPAVQIPKVYTMYNFKGASNRRPLPIDSYKAKILDSVAASSVVIVQGYTGCGKTTQIPQFILDQCYEQNAPCNIVVTQPRRVAAKHIAERVCEERGWGLGTVCGYQIGLDTRADRDTILTYVTIEVLLQKLIHQKSLNAFTHVIIDEAHERTKSLDLLLLIVRKYWMSNSQNVKILLMSATIEADQFAYYFRTVTASGPEFSLAPVVRIKKKSEFHTAISYLDTYTALMPSVPELDYDEPKVHPQLYELCANLICNFPAMERSRSDQDTTTSCSFGYSVLVFLPGYREIEELHLLLSSRGQPWEIYCMHSSLPSEEIHRAFAKPRKGFRKIILATNLAESSITVPDAYYVIDFCLTKNLVLNPITKFTSLRLEWASHNNCIQRAGRVGRVSNGRVFRFVTADFYKVKMQPQGVPEIQRAPLENIILYVKMLEINDTPRNILAQAISQPNLEEVQRCIWHLKEIGAMSMTCRGIKSTQDGDLSFLGRVMGSLPIDVHLSKLIVLGYMFGVVNDAIIMAAGCTIENLYVRTQRDRLAVYRKKVITSDGSRSDLLLLLNLYNVWQTRKRERLFANITAEYNWCRTNFIDFKRLSEWSTLVVELNNRLERFGMTTPMTKTAHQRGISQRTLMNTPTMPPPLLTNELSLSPTEKPTILKVVICGAFYPNFFVRSEPIDMTVVDKLMNGRNPFTNVYFTNMKKDQPGQIYTEQIRQLLQLNETSQIQVSYDPGACRLFVEFKNTRQKERLTATVNDMPIVTDISFNIPNEIYECVKMRQLKTQFPLRIISDSQSWNLYHKSVATKDEKDTKEDINCFSESSFSPLPPLDIEYMSVTISCMINVGHFYCHHVSQETKSRLQDIARLLNSAQMVLEPASTIQVNKKTYIGRYNADGQLYRCTVALIDHQGPGRRIKVFFVDYGNTETISANELYELPLNMGSIFLTPPLAICCTLAGIQPSQLHNPKSEWSEHVNTFFHQQTSNRVLNAKIYSVVDDVVYVELFQQPTYDRSRSVNQLLVDKAYAVKFDETGQSKADHELRVRVQTSDNPTEEMLSVYKQHVKTVDYPLPSQSDYIGQIMLKGPHSPLEMKLNPLTANAIPGIHVEEDSINSVLLDDFPLETYSRLVVAAHVGQSAFTENIHLRQTTIMPNIRGFPALMALLFCPTMEPKINARGTDVGSILCGMGAKDGTTKSLYEEHDLCVNLDTEIRISTIAAVNEIRHHMNMILRSMCSRYAGEADNPNFSRHRLQLKTSLMRLLLSKQTPMELKLVKHRSIWNKSEYKQLKVMRTDPFPFESTDPWPYLNFVELANIPPHIKDMMDSIDRLTQMARDLGTEKSVECTVCKETCYTRSEAQLHLLSDQHKINAAQYKL